MFVCVEWFEEVPTVCEPFSTLLLSNPLAPTTNLNNTTAKTITAINPRDHAFEDLV